MPMILAVGVHGFVFASSPYPTHMTFHLMTTKNFYFCIIAFSKIPLNLFCISVHFVSFNYIYFNMVPDMHWIQCFFPPSSNGFNHYSDDFMVSFFLYSLNYTKISAPFLVPNGSFVDLSCICDKESVLNSS